MTREKYDDDQKDTGSEELANFMKLRGKQFKPMFRKPLVKELGIDNDPIQCSQSSTSDSCSTEANDCTRPRDSAQLASQQIIPQVEPCERLRFAFLNNLLLQQKPLLVQFLESQISENFRVIYRDLGHGSSKGPDLIINTTMCLFIISLQLLNQRPLPGQLSRTGLSATHDQICAALETYDQVFVLVHFVPSGDSHADVRDQATRSDFVSFCNKLSNWDKAGEQTILPIWLPCFKASSTSELVNAWLWRVIRQYAYSPQPCTQSHVQGALIDDVTLWEILLVKAGLNPMAAQVMIGLVRNPLVGHMPGCHSDASWGLRRLMDMHEQERHDICDAAVGRRAVERLCEAVSR